MTRLLRNASKLVSFTLLLASSGLVAQTATGTTSAKSSPSSPSQDRQSAGHSIGTVTTHGNLIILTLDENALEKPHLFDLMHRTVRFTPDGARYRAEPLPEAWDNDFGEEMKGPLATLTQFTFPFSGKTWNAFSVGVNGSIVFGEPAADSQSPHRPSRPANRDGGLAVERYALLQRVGSSLINNVPAIAAFFKPRMMGIRYLKEQNDRAVVTWILTEPYGGIQDWTWKPTVNRIQATLHKDGVIDLTWDEVTARDGVVGIFPGVQPAVEKQIAALRSPAQSGSTSAIDIRSIKLSTVDGVFLKAVLDMSVPVDANDDPKTLGSVYRLCLSAAKPDGPCANGAVNTTMWTVRSARRYREDEDDDDHGRRYMATGPGVTANAVVQGNSIMITGVLPKGVAAGQQMYVSASVQTPGADQPVPTIAQPVRLAGIGSPEMRLATIKKQDGAFPVIFESFYYAESPRPNDLTCSVIKALGDRFDLLAYYSDFRIDNPEAGTPSTGPLGGGPNGGAVTGIAAEQRNLGNYCTKGRFQWQYVQPVYMGSNQMDEYPPDDITDTNRHNVTGYTHQLAERTFNGKIPPYDYAISQIGHEMGHRWSAFISAKINGELIPLGPTHWATGLQAPAAFPYQRPTEASIMGGGVWQDNFDGTWTQLDDDYYVPATGWSYLDLYLMGLIAPSEVPDFFLLRKLVPQQRDANGHMIFKADRTKVTINDVIAAEGQRLPDVDHAQKRFNTGMVIVLEHGHKPPPGLLKNVEGICLRWMDYWETTTGHRSVMTSDPN